MKVKYIVIGLLGATALVGFGIAASKTNGGKGTGGTVVPSVQYAEVGPKIGGGAGWDATLYDSGSPIVSLSAADKSAAIALVHAKMKEKGVAFYFIFTQLDDGTWWASGYHGGESASEDMGPYADQALAMQAGTAWVQKAAAVPTPSP